MSVAENACHLLNINIPCLIDGIDNSVNRTYAAWPDRIYCIDTTGRIAVMGGHGPGGFAPSIQATEQWLQSVRAFEDKPTSISETK